MSDGEYGPLSRLFPQARVELKFGIERKSCPLEPVDEGGIHFRNEWVELAGSQESLPSGTRYRLRLRNVSTRSIRLARLRFPASGGLGAFLEGADPRHVAFLRNGHQSWSTARSYRISEKPLRPRFRLVSLATSNMANLPSNTPGMLSSEMYSIIQDLETRRSFLVGQTPPFHQFFYIIFNVDPRGRSSYVELIYDFGRQLVGPGQELALDGFLFLVGSRPEVEQAYFDGIRDELGYRPPESNLRGWCSWYQYYDRIDPDILYKNLRAIREQGIDLDFFQIDDGWQSAVGDWLSEAPAFRGRMRELAEAIKSAGLRPGLWLAPFAASSRSEVYRSHPEYLLKDELGIRLPAGFNPIWKGLYYGLDATHPDFREELSEALGVMTKDWGFEYLKCDFLFSACLRGAVHHELRLSRSQVLRSGLELVRKSAAPGTLIIGCGMPLSSGIGLVDAARVGPDTGHFWIDLSAGLLRTGSMVGLRNSLRNSLVRAPMHKRLWLNDPDCLMIRDRYTRLSEAERRLQIHVIALTGGILMYSDDFSLLSEAALAEIPRIESVSRDCFKGRAVAVDLMERELPEILYNTSGYVGFFNFEGRRGRKVYELQVLRRYEPALSAFVDVWTGERVLPGERLILNDMPRRGSRLFRIERTGA